MRMNRVPTCISLGGRSWRKSLQSAERRTTDLILHTMLQRGIPCVLMRGGSSKGLYFLAADLPSDVARRDRVLLATMGSPDVRQIDGLGGGDDQTSKVILVGPSQRSGIDVEYLFAQVSVSRDLVDTTPNSGNMLSGVAPFAIERGLVKPRDPSTLVRIFDLNTGRIVEAEVRTPRGKVTYQGDSQLDGVPGRGSPDFSSLHRACRRRYWQVLADRQCFGSRRRNSDFVRRFRESDRDGRRFSARKDWLRDQAGARCRHRMARPTRGTAHARRAADEHGRRGG